jgi:cytochrome c55X
MIVRLADEPGGSYPEQTGRSCSLSAGAALVTGIILCVSAVAGPVSSDRSDELRHLLYQDCGSCHGMQLTGGLGPALTPAALDGKPRELLIATVREGRPGTPMPPWKAHLSDDEIAWLVDYLIHEVDAR